MSKNWKPKKRTSLCMNKLYILLTASYATKLQSTTVFWSTWNLVDESHKSSLGILRPCEIESIKSGSNINMPGGHRRIYFSYGRVTIVLFFKLTFLSQLGSICTCRHIAHNVMISCVYSTGTTVTVVWHKRDQLRPTDSSAQTIPVSL